VADEIERWFTVRAADGFNLQISRPGEFKKFREQVLPILQKRGLFKTEYFADTLRRSFGFARAGESLDSGAEDASRGVMRGRAASSRARV